MEAIIRLENVSFRHPLTAPTAAPALDRVTLEIAAGEWVAIVGANGSGKTTLARHLNALLKPTTGRVLVNGLDTRESQNLPTIHSLVGMVFQHPENQIVATTVEEDVAFGPENLAQPPTVIRERVEEALAAAGISALRTRAPHLLSAGQIQRVALAGILAMRPQVIIFDESTAMLDPAGRHDVLNMLQQLNRQGLTVIMITHFMDEAARAGRIIALEHGRTALDGAPNEVFADESALTSLGLEPPPVARLANELRPFIPSIPHGVLDLPALLDVLPAYPGSKPPPAHQPVIDPHPDWIRVEGLAHTYLAGTPLSQVALENVNLQAGEGRTHGLMGATGSGKSTLLQHLNGLLRPQKGRVQVGNLNLNDDTLSLRTVTDQVGLVFQNPDNQFFMQYVGDEIAYGLRLRNGRNGLAAGVRRAMELAGLDFKAFKDRLTFTLSGGERRKVALASALALQPAVLLLDEPTAGLDPAARRALLKNLRGLQQEGMTLVVSSHQMGDLAYLSSGMTVLYQGRDLLHGNPAEVFAQGDTLRSHGLEPPSAFLVAEALRRLGWPISPDLVHTDPLVEAVREAAA